MVFLFTLMQMALLKRMISTSISVKCLEDIKAWMTLNFLNFIDIKTEVIVFGGTTGPPPVGLTDWHKPQA